MKIELKSDALPPVGPVYSMSELELCALREYLDEMLGKGFIRSVCLSSSPRRRMGLSDSVSTTASSIGSLGGTDTHFHLLATFSISCGLPKYSPRSIFAPVTTTSALQKATSGLPPSAHAMVHSSTWLCPLA